VSAFLYPPPDRLHAGCKLVASVSSRVWKILSSEVGRRVGAITLEASSSSGTSSGDKLLRLRVVHAISGLQSNGRGSDHHLPHCRPPINRPRYFLRRLRRVKKANGQIISVNEVRLGGAAARLLTAVTV